jgi:ABC-type polysaccharide/polyol phosphate export permease
MFKSLRKRNTWDLIGQFFRTDFKLKYNDSVLGFLWVLLKPLAIFLVTYTVTSRVFLNQSIEYYPVYLLMGTIFSSFWSEATLAGLNSIRNKSGLILKVNFPRFIVVISSTLIPIINFLINMLIFLIIFFFFIHPHTYPGIAQYLWFILCFAGLYILVFAFSLFTSIFYVKFRDLQHIWELVLSMLFWVTPIVYNPDKIFHNAGFANFVITKLNPLSVFMASGRNALLYNEISHPEITLIWLGIGIIFSILGYFYFRVAVKRVAEDF